MFVELLRPGDVSIAAHVVALQAPGQAAIVESTGEFWIEPDRPVVVGDGAVLLSFIAIRVAAIVERLAQVGIELYRLSMVRDRAIELAFRAPLDTATRKGDGSIAYRQLGRRDGTGAGRDRGLASFVMTLLQVIGDRGRREAHQCGNDSDHGSATRRAQRQIRSHRVIPPHPSPTGWVPSNTTI